MRSGGSAASHRGARRWAPYVFAAAAALYLLVFTAVPLLRGAALSLTDTRLLNPVGGRPVGLENYADQLTDATFWTSVATTVVYTAATVAV